MNRYKSPISVTHPELAAEAVGWDTSTLTAGSVKKVEWQCKNNHIWSDSVNHRTSGRGCPYCSRNRVMPGETDLITKFPDIAMELVNPDNKFLAAHSNKKVSWRCQKGHIWRTSVSQRSGKHGTGCPVCSNKIVLTGFNDLATTNPELAAEADGWDPSTLTAYSNKKVGWKCSNGHEWKTIVGNRSKGKGCPFCSNRIVLAGYNDLATVNPELAAQAYGWDTSTLTTGSHKKVAWECGYGHIWSAPVVNRSRGAGCPVCINQAILIGYNDFATTHPELAAQAYDWDPTTLTAGVDKKVGWRCKKGHIWKAVVNNRSKGLGCPVCSNQLVLAGYNDLATINPALAAQADGWDVTTLTPYSNQKVGWKCEQGHTWKSRLNTRSAGIGCPSCAKYGFDPNKNGWLYLIQHDELGMFQIGISNSPKQRLAKHTNRDWEVIEIRGPMDGALARSFETSILKSLKMRGAIMAHKTDIRQFDGWTEAWTRDSLSVTSFKQLLGWVYEDDEKQLTTKAL